MTGLSTIEHDVELVATKVRDGFVAVFHAVEHEVPAILGTLVKCYGPEVVAHAIATHQAGIQLYADRAVDLAEADTKALVQSVVVERFHLPPTAAQYIAGALHHVFTIGKDKIDALIAAGAAKAEAAIQAGPTT